jgi:hypothetical protein
MDILQLKIFIYENNRIEDILQQIGCHSIKYHSSGYYTCGNIDGDNKQSVTDKNKNYLLTYKYWQFLI